MAHRTRWAGAQSPEDNMRPFSTFAIAALICTGVAPALGADATGFPAPGPSQPMIASYSDPSFDWNGFYAGVFGIMQTDALPATGYGGGFAAGTNAVFEYVLVGAEVSASGLTDGAVSTAYGQVLARAGVIVTDEVMVYGAAGYGVDLVSPGTDHFLAGGGLEVAVTNDISLRGQYLYGVPLGAAASTNQFTFGANYHF